MSADSCGFIVKAAEIDIWALVESNIVIICSTIPVLRVLLKKIASHDAYQEHVVRDSGAFRKPVLVRSSTFSLDLYDKGEDEKTLQNPV